ncbi:MAG TPA: MBL fold metallo-hydrolase, partial [Microbacterium sp.]|nr:MBL fold metallo-hydrolase [Microbacterium sp.]
ANFGDVPRYGTARCAASIRDVLSNADWEDLVAEGLPPEHADEIPMELLGLITGLPAHTARVPWDGPKVGIIEHRAHAPGHAALLLEDARVLVAGDMLSDILMPFLDLEAANPIEDYLIALQLFESVADGVDAVIPGHGSVGGTGQLRARIELDRALCRRCRTAVTPTTREWVRRPRWSGSPTWMTGNDGGSPKRVREQDRRSARRTSPRSLRSTTRASGVHDPERKRRWQRPTRPQG